MRVALRAICPICKKEFKVRKNGKQRIQIYCSKQCSLQGLSPFGNLLYFAKKYNMTEKEFMQLIDKRALCVTTGQVFESAGKAAEYYGLDNTKVCAAARNNKTYGSYNGERLAWRYI